MYGSDQSASMEMDEMVKLTKYIDEMLDLMDLKN